MYGFWGPGVQMLAPAAQVTVSGVPDAPVSGPEPVAVTVAFVSSEAGSTAFRRGVAIRVEGGLAPGPQFVRIVNATDRSLIGLMNQNVLTLNPDATEDDLSRRVAVFGPLSPGAAQSVFVDLRPGLLDIDGAVTTPINPAYEETYSGWSDATTAAVPVESV